MPRSSFEDVQTKSRNGATECGEGGSLLLIPQEKLLEVVRRGRLYWQARGLDQQV
jgi:hypothetical protein